MVDDAFKKHVDVYVDEVWEDVVSAIGELVSIDSVADESAAAPGAPWGAPAAAALEKALSIAAGLGLEAHNEDGHIGYADLPGADAVQLATIAHADIVPVGSGWTVDPLAVTRKDGYLLGRGVLDDKGPLVLSLYAAHFFARRVAAGAPLPHTLRCIVGACEETTMSDVAWYLEHHDAPDFLFTPDADFPLICGEKGVFHGRFSAPAPNNGVIAELDGGIVVNAVPGKATAVVRADAAALPAAAGIEVIAEDGCARLVAHGKGGHASLPEGTVNAIGMLVSYLLDQGLYADAERPFLRLVRDLCTTTDGSALGIACSNERFGPLTCIGGTIRLTGGRLVQTVDIRYPDATTASALTAALNDVAAQSDCDFCVLDVKEPFFADPASPAVQTLLATYGEYSGCDAAPIVIGGGTYARLFPHACAFGPHDPSRPYPRWVGPEHGADEGVSEDDLRRALKIYIVSLARLMELDFPEACNA